MYKLVVTGYIRELETSLIKKIVPSEIKLLCIEYYYSNSKLILVSNEIHNSNDKGILITDIDEEEETKNNTVWNAKLNDLPKSMLIQHPNQVKSYNVFNYPFKQWIVENSAICCYSNIMLPKYVLSATKLTGNHNNNVIFKCGGYNSYNNTGPAVKDCCAIILNDNDFIAVDTKECMKPYYWELPLFKHARYGNTLIYSKWYGLLSIGGVKGGFNSNSNSNEIMSLSFSDLDNMDKKWEWRQIARMENKLRDVSCTMINDRTLFICGGTKGSNSDSKEVAIYDFEIAEWIPLRQSKYARSKMGIYFDKIEKRVYCVGGNESSFPVNKCEYYSLERNEWFRLPNTSGKHGYYPLIWKQTNNKNILLCTSYIRNCIETYDLRNETAIQYTRNFNYGWSMIYGKQDCYPMYQSSLEDIFHTKFKKYGLAKCAERILKFNDDYY